MRACACEQFVLVVLKMIFEPVRSFAWATAYAKLARAAVYMCISCLENADVHIPSFVVLLWCPSYIAPVKKVCVRRFIRTTVGAQAEELLLLGQVHGVQLV